MRADSDSCHCEKCGVVCKGRFQACPSVWAQGPQPVVIAKVPSQNLIPGAAQAPGTNGHVQPEPAATEARPPVAGPVAAGRATVGGASAAATTKSNDPAGPGVETGAGVLRWFQNAFDTLRQEVEGLRGALSQEQAMVATLVESRHDEAGLDAALRSAIRSETADLEARVAAMVDNARRELETRVGDSLESVRHDLEAVRVSHEANFVALTESLAAAASAIEAAAGTPAELNRRDAANRKAFRATLNEELQPLVDVVAESVAQSDYELKAVGRKLDGLKDSGAVLAAAVAEVIESMATVAAAVLTDPESVADDESVPSRSQPFGGAENDGAYALARRATVTRSTPASARPSAQLPGGPRKPASRGTRVSLRNQRPEV